MNVLWLQIFVRALDLDERLVGIAFLDVGVYVTSLRTIKNFLLIGDIIKSVWFVAFQEEPFKLIVLAKDVQPLAVTSADFLFNNNGEFYIAIHDEEGVVRLLEYDPIGVSASRLLISAPYHLIHECFM